MLYGDVYIEPVRDERHGRGGGGGEVLGRDEGEIE